MFMVLSSGLLGYSNEEERGGTKEQIIKLSRIAVFISLLCFIAAGVLLYREAQFLNQAESVTGTVKTFRISEDSEIGGTSYCPLIEYTAKSGETFLFNTLICSSPAPYEPGEQVTVFYEPGNPENRQVDSFWGKYVWPFTAGSLGVLVILLELINLGIKSLVQKMKGRLGI